MGAVPVPTTIACGVDVLSLMTRSRELAERLRRGRHRVPEDMAHLPSLEEPALIASLLTEALADGVR